MAKYVHPDEKVAALEARVASLEAEPRFIRVAKVSPEELRHYTNAGYNSYNSLHLASLYHNIHLVDAVTSLMKKVGVEYTYDRGKPPEAVLTDIKVAK